MAIAYLGAEVSRGNENKDLLSNITEDEAIRVKLIQNLFEASTTVEKMIDDITKDLHERQKS